MAEKAPKSEVTFEAAKKRLGAIVEKLEEGELPLEESLRLFEEGISLARTAQEKLDGAEKRIEVLLKVDEQGRAKTAPFQLRDEDEDL
jgi:exodeoxyribonuclease VII small subunit